MLRYLKFYGCYALFLMAYFTLTRTIFLLFQYKALSSALLKDIGGSFLHGAHMDASFTGYILLLFAVIIAFIAPFSYAVTRRALKTLAVLLLLCLGTFTFIDAELFKHWGSRLDATPLLYLTHPRETLLGALPLKQMLFLAALTIIWIIITIRIFMRHIMPLLPQKRLAWSGIPVFLLLAALCIIPIRGNFGTAPMNHGMVAFSGNSFVNQAALNMPWNLMHSLLHRDRIKSYSFMPEKEAQRIAKPYFTNSGSECYPHIIKNMAYQPNVLIVILESWAARFIGCAGGEKGITPCFDALSKEGVLFTHIYASGTRTERGVVSVLSGYPSQTKMPIISINSKLKQLSALSNDFAQQDYRTAFFYGGDISFVNMRTYILEKQFERYTSISDFGEKRQHNKWGAYDEFLYERMFAELDTMRKPFFAAVLTLSNHEPYDVPMKPVIAGTPDNPMHNAAYYADRCLGNFIAQCRRQTWWDSTLVVLVGNHGKQVLPTMARYDTATIRIPMLWLGGVLDTVCKIDKIASQHDIAATLLNCLKMPANNYRFSRSILDTAQTPFAMHIFDDGFTFVTDSAAVIFDNTIYRSVNNESDSTERSALRAGQAIFQIYNKHFLDL